MEKDLYLREHEGFVRRIVPLMIHHVWRCGRSGMACPPLEEMLGRYIDLWRKTVHYDGGAVPADEGFSHAAWTEMCGTLGAFFERYGQGDDSEDLERACADYLWPMMEPRLFEDSRPPRPDESRPYGAWTLTFRENDVLSIHITNVYRPDSLFDHPNEFSADLLYLIYETCEAYPRLRTLFCGSWLNNLPPFQKFFPPEWAPSLHRPVHHNDTNGIWGQYVTRTGGFHEENAAYMRRHGRHRYPLIHGQCGIASAIAFLEGERRGQRQ